MTSSDPRDPSAGVSFPPIDAVTIGILAKSNDILIARQGRFFAAKGGGLVQNTGHTDTVLYPIKSGTALNWKATAYKLADQLYRAHTDRDRMARLKAEAEDRSKRADVELLSTNKAYATIAGRHAELGAHVQSIKNHWAWFLLPKSTRDFFSGAR